MSSGEKLGSRTNVLWGLRIGLIIATGFSLWVTVVGLLFGGRAFERFGLSWIEIVAIYYVALSLGGGAAGAVLPLKRYALGAMLFGFLLMLPMYLAVSIALTLSVELFPSLKFAVLLGLVIGAIGGSALGLWIWNDEKEEREGTGR